jgi:membrane-associated phospholipid phosphatase
MSIDARRRAFSIAFVALLALSVVWPDPVVDINRLCCDANLGVDELSFLGREAPSWDVVFWFLAGLMVIALLQQPEFDAAAIREEARSVGLRRASIVFIAATVVVVAAVWFWADEPLMAMAEQVASTRVKDAIRLANRFGGGMNPAMVIGFFVLAGAAFRQRKWIWSGLAMALAGAAAGLFVQILKFAVGRSRPELWLGAFHHARVSASSFPSGHTVGAFALAGVLFFNADSKTLRVIALLLAIGVGVSRILAFRHWPSDVLASAAVGLLAAASVGRDRPTALPPYGPT